MEPTNDDHLNKENLETGNSNITNNANNTNNTNDKNDTTNTTNTPGSAYFISKKRNVPVSSLSGSEDEVSSTDKDSGSSNKKSKSDLQEGLDEMFNLPTLKIQPILGGKPLSFPVHPRLTLIDLRDFILFSLNIPHPQQILSFRSGEEGKLVMLSNYSENTLLCSVPGLIDELTGRCAPVSLSFKISSGMDFSVHPSDVEYDNNSGTGDDVSDSSSYFEICGNGDDPTSAQLSALASSIASLIPFPPGVDKSSRMLFRSLSKSSPTNSNLPTLWEIYFPESGVKMMVTALINVNEVRGNSEGDLESEPKEDELKESEPKAGKLIENKSKEDELKECEIKTTESTEMTKIPAPTLVITPPLNTNSSMTKSVTIDETPTLQSPSPKIHCEKCRLKCRPALRFICKCNKTFCQSHRYPDQHDCTFDYRADGIATIQANNPKIVKDKVGNF